MKIFYSLCALFVGSVVLSGCAITPFIGAAAVFGTGLYCSGTSEEAKDAVRGAVTGGKQVLNCDD